MRTTLVILAVALALSGCALKKVKVPLKPEKDSGVQGEAMVAEVKSDEGGGLEASFSATDPKLRPLRGFIYKGTCAARGALAQDASTLPRTEGSTAPTKLDGDLDYKTISGKTHSFVVQENTSGGEVLSCGEIP